MADVPKIKASLPPGLIVRLGKTVWQTMWQVMMARLAPTDNSGAYTRPASAFRQTVEPDSTYEPAAGRYRLTVGFGWRWANRSLGTWAV